MPFGRFERTVHPRPMGEINVTPLVDVMLVLVVIFILTAPLLASSIQLDLPRGASGTAAEAGASVAVSIDRNGQWFLRDLPVDRATLERELAQTARAAPTTEVRLRADRAVPYGAVVELMDAARRGGLYRIGFVTDPQTAAEGETGVPDGRSAPVGVGTGAAPASGLPNPPVR